MIAITLSVNIKPVDGFSGEPPEPAFLLLADGASFFLLADGTSKLLLND
jgi:hypothetical protein